MRKNRVKLTESQLHNVIKESVKKVLKESSSEDILGDIVADAIIDASAIDAFKQIYNRGNSTIMSFIYHIAFVLQEKTGIQIEDESYIG